MVIGNVVGWSVMGQRMWGPRAHPAIGLMRPLVMVITEIPLGGRAHLDLGVTPEGSERVISRGRSRSSPLFGMHGTKGGRTGRQSPVPAAGAGVHCRRAHARTTMAEHRDGRSRMGLTEGDHRASPLASRPSRRCDPSIHPAGGLESSDRSCPAGSGTADPDERCAVQWRCETVHVSSLLIHKRFRFRS